MPFDTLRANGSDVLVMSAKGEERTGRRGISRRTLLVGGGVGAGLALAWGVWPRRYPPNLRARPDEAILNAFLKIGRDGRVMVALPQAELGQGVATALPQILADELGADWRQVGVETAPLSPLYANQLLAETWSAGALPSFLGDIGRWTAREIATRDALMLTGGSTSVRAFEPRLREAGAAARALLQMAAADRWGAAWQELDSHGGFVWRGEERLPFGELAAAAAAFDIPAELPSRTGPDHRLIGQPLPRLDAPTKVDGTALFAADVRLPDMVYASVNSAPPGATLARADEAAAERIPEALMIFRNPHWIGAVATNSWAADRAVAALAASWNVTAPGPDNAALDAALTAALEGGDAESHHRAGDVDLPFQVPGPSALYAVGIAPHAPPETLTATARAGNDRLEIWAPTQAPGLARAAAARAAGLAESQVVVYPMLAIGGGYGRKLEMDAIEQAAIMSRQLRRPVQLSWSRLQDIRHDRPRPPAMARLEGRLGPNGVITAWRARIAAPDATGQVAERIGLRTSLNGGADTALAGAVPPYSIPAVAIDRIAADLPLQTGAWRSGALSATAFFNESFVDELARGFGLEPLSFRMQILGGNTRLARCLTTATALGGWDGGPPGSSMGLAALSAYGSHIATMVEIEIGSDQRLRVTRAVCAVDCGRIVNPELVRQQIEGGLIHGIAAAIGPRLQLRGGMPVARTLGDLQLPTLADSPAVTVELIESEEAPGGVTELAVPTAAPAIANALHALTGERVRRLPLAIGSR
jgi:isoquinoline 1-oxidoreductase beta subunit